jgi:ankyrin repeat protein
MQRVGILASLILLKFASFAHAEINSDLLEKAWFGHTAAVKTLLTEGADVDAKDNEGKTAAMWAAEDENEDITELLKQAGAEK